jgi:hypothetical protein
MVLAREVEAKNSVLYMGARDRGSQWRNRLLRTKERSAVVGFCFGERESEKRKEVMDEVRLSKKLVRGEGPDACCWLGTYTKRPVPHNRHSTRVGNGQLLAKLE